MEKIQFTENYDITKIQRTSHKNVIVLDNVLDEDESKQISELSLEDGRKDIDFIQLSTVITSRIQSFLPSTIFEPDNELKSHSKHDHDNNNQYWYFQEIYPYWKFYRKPVGNSLGLHYDKVCVYNVDCKSIFSTLLYLQESDGNLFIQEENIEIEPKMGRMIIFHMKNLHKALPNIQSTKIFLRSKLMFVRGRKIEKENDKEAIQIYRESLPFSRTEPEKYQSYYEKACSLSPLFERTSFPFI